MTLDAFLRDREPVWNELDELVRRAKRRPQRLGPEGVSRLGTLYRAAAADLALARRRFPGDPLLVRLEDLVGRARHLIYSRPPRASGVVEFFLHGYWRLVAERWKPLAIATSLLFVPAFAVAVWAQVDPDAVLGLVPEQFRHSLDAGGSWQAMSPDEQAAFTAGIFTNNIQVTALAFAGGMTLGALTALSMLYNGVIMGAVAGLMIQAGNGRGFVELVTAHGVLEISCVVVAGAAGLSLGWAIIEPGLQTRSASLGAEARKTVLIILGTAPWLVLAGIIEGNRAQLALSGLPTVVGVGFAVGGFYWLLVVLLGRRPRGEPSASRADRR